MEKVLFLFLFLFANLSFAASVQELNDIIKKYGDLSAEKSQAIIDQSLSMMNQPVKKEGEPTEDQITLSQEKKDEHERLRRLDHAIRFNCKGYYITEKETAGLKSKYSISFKTESKIPYVVEYEAINKDLAIKLAYCKAFEKVPKQVVKFTGADAVLINESIR